MKRLLLAVATCAVVWVTGCSGGGSTPPPPPPVVGFSNASLKGTYVFSMSGSTDDPATASVDSFSRVGIFIADGGGNIATTGGLQDQHQFGSDNPFSINGGSYVVNSDGRGSLCLETSGGEVQYSISLSSTSAGYMVDMGTVTSCPGTGTNVNTETASGSFQLQSATTLANGTYIFDFSGIAPASGDAISIIGDLVASGTNGIGSFSSGSFADVNEGGTLIPKTLISGAYQVDSNNAGTGRGLATINGLNYVYYVIDGQHAEMMEIDADQVTGGTNLGEAVAQQAGTPTNVSSFSNNSFVYVLGGSNVSDGGPHTRAVRLTASGSALSAILLDDNNEGTFVSIPATGVLTGGTVTLDGDGSGRGTFTFTENASNTFTFVFYLSSATQGVIQDVSTTEIAGVPTPVEVADGAILAQTGAPFSSSSLATNYAFNWSGVSSAEEDFVGSFAPASASTNGLVDFNEFGTAALFLNNAFNGVITIGGDGTGSTGQHSTFVATITGTPPTTINYFAYIANPSTILVMGTGNGSKRLIAGVLTAQTP
jgi:hypothetical protein